MLSRVNVIGSEISVCSIAGGLDLVDQRLRDKGGGYVCFSNVHAVVMGRRDAHFRAITNGSFLSLPDGKPVYWVGLAKGATGIGHVPGPDFFLEAMRRFPTAGHFFYGSSPEVLRRLKEAIELRVENVRICGTISPPFRALTSDEKASHYQTIRQSGAGFVWVGLGAPKQEQWISEASENLRPSIVFGVGAAFDFYAGTVKRAPDSWRSVGLEWLHRLWQEPRRLWKRYLVTNSLFIFYVSCEALGLKPRKATRAGRSASS